MKKLNKILLVDDDSTTLYINENILNKLGISHEVKVLNNGKLALDHLLTHCGSASENCPALVILDHHMPIMDGMELMQALNKTDVLANSNIVFLLLAVNTTLREQEVFKNLGVQEFTSKPLSRQTVLEAYAKYWAGDTAADHTTGWFA